MSHRRNRDAPTKGRRIHATDEEWSSVQAAAAKAEQSVSAYVVQAALPVKAPAPDERLGGAIRLLTACHALLSEIADRETQVSDIDAAGVASGLHDVAALLEAFMVTITGLHDSGEASSCC
ncbi:hypothetical protein [Donghicola sp. XS_ASV15]|uniref:hypothetical protein n=1 Tax=Donghicola sp. XS_ASV15 TaxID=3241295 RepID=UPI00351230C1